MTNVNKDNWYRGLFWALLSPIFLGVTPILAKIAYEFEADVYTVAAFRTVAAALILWGMTLLIAPKYIRSSSVAIFSSVLAGGINGVGSIFYYSSLEMIDASLGQLINITYLVFVTVLLRMIGQQISLLTIMRTGLAIFAVYLLTMGGVGEPHWQGVIFMLVAALSYAVQLVLSQRILRDIPAQTMTLYAITGMAGVVTAAWLVVQPSLSVILPAGWVAIVVMGLVTAIARLTMFLGVKQLGSLQTALLSIGEVLVSIFLAVLLLNEQLTAVQWVGALLITMTVLLVKYEKDVPTFDWWSLAYRHFTRKE